MRDSPLAVLLHRRVQNLQNEMEDFAVVRASPSCTAARRPSLVARSFRCISSLAASRPLLDHFGNFRGRSHLEIENGRLVDLEGGVVFIVAEIRGERF